jgi:hypothetical protein
MSSNMSLAVRNTDQFHYQVLPSAFQLIEGPTYLCWQAFRFESDQLWNLPPVEGSYLKNRGLAVLIGAGGFAGGVVAMPITLCAAPITAVADIVLGLLKLLFAACMG